MGIGDAHVKRFSIWAFLAWVVFAIVPTMASPQCRADLVEIKTASGSIARFTVELAADDRARATGLMNRPSMPRSAGMLFVYPRPVQASFWMKNTLIPLDMIFADRTGRVTRVHPNAIPLDLTPIDGGRDVMFVLEINGGLAARLGLSSGSVLRHPSIEATTAAWPCPA